MNMSKVFRSFIFLFGALIVSSILTLIIMGKDAYLLGGTSNQITIVTPEYSKMQWDAMMAHPMLIIPAIIVLAAVGYFLYNFSLVWKRFGAKGL